MSEISQILDDLLSEARSDQRIGRSYLPLLQNADADIRLAAAESVAVHGPDAADTATVDALAKRLAQDESAAVRAASADALGALGEAAAGRDSVRASLKTRLFDPDDTSVALASVRAIHRLWPYLQGDAEISSALRQVASDGLTDPVVRKWAQSALAPPTSLSAIAALPALAERVASALLNPLRPTRGVAPSAGAVAAFSSRHDRSAQREGVVTIDGHTFGWAIEATDDGPCLFVSTDSALIGEVILIRLDDPTADASSLGYILFGPHPDEPDAALGALPIPETVDRLLEIQVVLPEQLDAGDAPLITLARDADIRRDASAEDAWTRWLSSASDTVTGAL